MRKTVPIVLGLLFFLAASSVSAACNSQVRIEINGQVTEKSSTDCNEDISLSVGNNSVNITQNGNNSDHRTPSPTSTTRPTTPPTPTIPPTPTFPPTPTPSASASPTSGPSASPIPNPESDSGFEKLFEQVFGIFDSIFNIFD